jgi:hypothetical protein
VNMMDGYGGDSGWEATRLALCHWVLQAGTQKSTAFERQVLAALGMQGMTRKQCRESPLVLKHVGCDVDASFIVTLF